jgi:serine/threonine-protein kinase
MLVSAPRRPRVEVIDTPQRNEQTMITPGTILSDRYLVRDELGAGGMSIVYRTLDLRTDAEVAVKAPHAFLLRDKQYVQRLQREARIAAGIRSSRVARVIDIGEHEGTPFLVMELAEGESLDARLRREGALPPRGALAVALEVARALDAAHAAGVVHRDLKPQNICITPQGDVKVLDFGIARMEGTEALTTASLFVGTPDYAAPERALGDCDIRSDIYALGVVLYELLAGRLPFSGATPWTVMQMHAAQPPPPLPEDVPPSVAAIVERCLEKRPEDRYQTPSELVDAIQGAIRSLERAEAVADPGQTLQMPPPAVTRVADTGGAVGSSDQRPDRSIAARSGPAPVLPAAPATRDSTRRRGRGPVLLAGTGVAALVVVALLAYGVFGRGDGESGAAGDDGDAPQPGGGPAPTLQILQPSDGARLSGPVSVQLDFAGVNLKAPAEQDPQGRHVHYFLDVDPATVLVPGQPIPTGQANIVHTANASHTFLDLPPGEHTVWAILTGNDHVPLMPSMQGKVTFTAIADPLVGARSGEAAPIVYQSLIDGRWRIVVKDGLNGAPRRLTSGDANDFNPAFSPDGTRIAFNSDRDGSHHIYTMNLDGSDLRRLTDGPSNNRSPAYSPDGTSIVFVSDRDGREHLWTIDVSGGEPRQFTRGPQNDGAPSWSLDGTRIYYQSDAGGGVTHIFSVDRRGGTPRQLTDGPARDNRPVPSPDGMRIAFARFEDNRWNIYVMNADGSDIRRLTDGNFNINPSWSPDGKQVLFQSDREGGQQQIFVVPSDGGEPRRVTQPGGINASPAWPLK